MEASFTRNTLPSFFTAQLPFLSPGSRNGPATSTSAHLGSLFALPLAAVAASGAAGSSCGSSSSGGGAWAAAPGGCRAARRPARRARRRAAPAAAGAGRNRRGRGMCLLRCRTAVR